MRPDISIQLVLGLAVQEVIAAEFEFIEPLHVFNAILKFAELGEQHFKTIVKGSDVIEVLMLERDAVREKLCGVSIEVPYLSTKIRRRLRSQLGKGRHPHDGKQAIHRSDVSRDICNKARNIAQIANKSQWSAVHLIEVLLDSPPLEVARVLKEVSVSVTKKAIATPLLEKYGRDLCALTAEDQSKGIHEGNSVVRKEPVCRVVINEILGEEKKSILLIQTGKRSPYEIVQAIAQLFAGDSPPDNARNRRIVEIKLSNIAGGIGEQKKFEKRMDALFQEVSQAGNIILFLDEFHTYINTNMGKNILELLKERLTRKTVQCIIAIDDSSYEKHVERNPIWKKLFRIIWIHDLNIPSQL